MSRQLKHLRAQAAACAQVERKVWRVTAVGVQRSLASPDGLSNRRGSTSSTSSSSNSSSAVTLSAVMGGAPNGGTNSSAMMASVSSMLGLEGLCAEEMKNVWEVRKHLIERGQREKLEKKAREIIEESQKKEEEKLAKKRVKEEKRAILAGLKREKEQRKKEKAEALKRLKAKKSSHGETDEQPRGTSNGNGKPEDSPVTRPMTPSHSGSMIGQIPPHVDTTDPSGVEGAPNGLSGKHRDQRVSPPPVVFSSPQLGGQTPTLANRAAATPNTILTGLPSNQCNSFLLLIRLCSSPSHTIHYSLLTHAPHNRLLPRSPCLIQVVGERE